MTKTDHVAALHAAAKAAGLSASRGEHGWHLHDIESGRRLTPADCSYSPQEARAFCEGYAASR